MWARMATATHTKENREKRGRTVMAHRRWWWVCYILSVVHHRAVSHERTNKRVYIVAYSLLYYSTQPARLHIATDDLVVSLDHFLGLSHREIDHRYGPFFYFFSLLCLYPFVVRHMTRFKLFLWTLALWCVSIVYTV